MKPKATTLGTHQPKVILMYQQEDDIAGVATLIAEQFDEYRTLKVSETNTKFLIDIKPAVILIALESVEESVSYYGELVEQELLDYPHCSILLCNNKQSALSFHCCLKGLFDNYFVYQPMYERYRLRLIIHYGMVNSVERAHYLSKQEEYIAEVDDELEQLIEEASQCKINLLARINNSEQTMMEAVEEIKNIKEHETIQASPQELYETITQNHIKPLLAVLESDIKTSLDDMINQIISQKQINKEQGEALQKAVKGPVRNAHKAAEIAAESNAEAQSSADALIDDLISDKQGILNPPPVKTEDKGILNPPPIKDDDIKSEVPLRKILVVEDNALYREMLVNVLTKENFIVEQAMDGINALQKIKEEEFDLIIMDLFMPKLDGLNTTKKIRQFSGRKDVPVIALTGNKNKEIVKKWAALGLKGYIMKPSTKEQILSSVAKAVS